MKIVEHLRRQNLSPDLYKFALETTLEVLEASLPKYEAMEGAINRFWLIMLEHADRSLGSALRRKARLRDVEQDRQEARRQFAGIVRGVREDITAIGMELERLEFLNGKTQPESFQPLPGKVSGSVDNTTGLDGQKSE